MGIYLCRNGESLSKRRGPSGWEKSDPVAEGGSIVWSH